MIAHPTLEKARRAENRLLLFSLQFLIKGLFNRALRSTKHYREWFHVPMNYARQMEIPLTLLQLNVAKNEKVLDVSSPKLLALYHASSVGASVVTSDLNNYFEGDFETYREALGLALVPKVIDAAASIPFEPNTFHKVFSISVLEHIPSFGDRNAFREMFRVLKPGGTMVVTVPAWRSFIEEWTTQRQYWDSITNDEGSVFFQRRYDFDSLKSRFELSDYSDFQVIWIAEIPVDEPKIGADGILQHNSYLVGRDKTSQRLLKLSKFLPRLPFLPYAAERALSRKSHYLTLDYLDPNIRQAVITVNK